MKSLKFSIIIPVYNVAPYLRECLDSVLAQTYSIWEAICVDDGSTDGSGEVLDEYAARDSRFRVIHQANAGVSAARNAALDMAVGDKILFVDGDDAIHPEMLKLYHDAYDKYQEADALIFSGYIEGEKKPSIWPSAPRVENLLYKTVRDEEAASMACCTSTIYCYRRELLGDLHFDTRLTLSEDSLFASQYWWKTSKWVFIKNANIYFYRQRSDSAVHAKMSCEKVKGSLEANILMTKLYLDNADKWERKNFPSSFIGSVWSAWFTTRNMFPKLSNRDMDKCLDAWIELNRLRVELARYKSWKHDLLIWLARVVHRGWFARELIKFSARINGHCLNLN